MSKKYKIKSNSPIRNSTIVKVDFLIITATGVIYAKTVKQQKKSKRLF